MDTNHMFISYKWLVINHPPMVVDAKESLNSYYIQIHFLALILYCALN